MKVIKLGINFEVCFPNEEPRIL